jgi:hypothetical protein
MTDPRDLVRLISLLALITGLVSCFSHQAFVSTTPSLGSERELTTQELGSLRQAIRERLASMGMIERPRLEWMRKVNDENRKQPYRVLDSYIPGPKADHYGDVEISVLQSKKDRGVVVLIRNNGWFTATKFTKALESGVEDVLSAQFPGKDITVTRNIVGPSIP